MAGSRDASWAGVAPWASFVEAWGARCEEGGVGRALEGTAACAAAAGGLEDAAVASDQVVHRVDHQGGHQGADQEVHLLGCLRETHKFRPAGN